MICGLDYVTPDWGPNPAQVCQRWVKPPAKISFPLAGWSEVQIATKKGSLHPYDWEFAPEGICSERWAGHGWKAYVDRCGTQIQVKLSRKGGAARAFVSARGPHS